MFELREKCGLTWCLPVDFIAYEGIQGGAENMGISLTIRPVDNSPVVHVLLVNHFFT